MYPKSIKVLIDLFTKFPSVGPRQASRFAFFVLKQNGGYLAELRDALKNLQEKVVFCSQCFRSMEANGQNGLCSLCADNKRDISIIAVVEKESDMQNLEKTGAYTGLYHVLGGTISPLDADSPKKIHLKELYERVKNKLEAKQKCEIVLATNPTTEGDTTALYIERVLAPLQNHFQGFKVSRLGRGLSLGSELEHVDETTLKNALKNRN